MCSHISYAFADIKDGKLSPFERNDEDSHWSKGMWVVRSFASLINYLDSLILFVLRPITGQVRHKAFI